jgi:hypothetical protein
MGKVLFFQNLFTMKQNTFNQYKAYILSLDKKNLMSEFFSFFYEGPDVETWDELNLNRAKILLEHLIPKITSQGLTIYCKKLQKDVDYYLSVGGGNDAA